MKVLDASVVLKWVLPEERHAEATAYRARHEDGTDPVVIPSLALYEIANTLRYKSGLDAAGRRAGLLAVLAARPEVAEVTRALLLAALEIAESRNISLYDATYMAVARQNRCPMVTADRRLWERLRGEPGVVLLGAEG